MHAYELLHVRRPMPVLIFEKLRDRSLIGRGSRRLLFYGKMQILGILLMGAAGYWLMSRYGGVIESELRNIIILSGIDFNESVYRIVEWGAKKGCLTLYVTRDRGRIGIRSRITAFLTNIRRLPYSLRRWALSKLINFQLKLYLKLGKLLKH